MEEKDCQAVPPSCPKCGQGQMDSLRINGGSGSFSIGGDHRHYGVRIGFTAKLSMRPLLRRTRRLGVRSVMMLVAALILLVAGQETAYAAAPGVSVDDPDPSSLKEGSSDSTAPTSR